MVATLAFISGLILASLVIFIFIMPRILGNMVIDQSDPDGPYIFLEIARREQFQNLKDGKIVALKVEVRDYISQK